jgi:beta-glucosidase
MPPSDFATADIDKVLNDLTTAEAILLTAGASEGLWYTQSVDRLGIPAIKVYMLMSLPIY